MMVLVLGAHCKGIYYVYNWPLSIKYYISIDKLLIFTVSSSMFILFKIFKLIKKIHNLLFSLKILDEYVEPNDENIYNTFTFIQCMMGYLVFPTLG